MRYTHDVILIGAGIAGSALALHLVQHGLRTVLVDQQAPQAPTAELNLRVSSIHFGSEQFLNNLGLDLNTQRRGIFNTIQLLQENSSSTLSFTASALGIPHLGSILENQVLIHALVHAYTAHAGASYYWPVNLETVQLSADGVSLQGQGMPELRAPLIIGADGAHSWLRKQYMIVQDEYAYAQTALVAHIRTQRAHNQVAYQRFLNRGPLAYLPLAAPNVCSIVWSSTPAHIAELAALDDAQCAQAVAHGLDQCLGEVELISARAQFPLVMRHAKRYIATRSAWVGDAIHTLHPLAGQGANLGLKDVAVLARVLTQAHLQRQDLGCSRVLRAYERERRGAHVLMLQAMHLLARTQKPAPELRLLAMQMTQQLPLLKRVLMRYALGGNLC